MQNIENFKETLDQIIKNCNIIYEVAQEQNLLNEQYFIDWLDELNELSVRH